MVGGGARRNRDVLPIRKDMNGDKIDRRDEIAIAQPEFPDIGVGHRHRHLGLHLADDVGKVAAREFAAQQHFVADHNRAI